MDPRDARREELERVAANDLSPQQMLERDHAFADVLGELIAVLESGKVPYGLIGGVASSGFGRPRWTHDIDVFVRPEDADRCLQLLAEHGFRTEKTDPHWLYKGFKQGVLVDIIFQSHGGIYLDPEMLAHVVMREHFGLQLRLISPEDLLIMKAVVHDEEGPRHWHDALGLIAGYRLDWEYLEWRAQRAPRRVLSLLVYAHSLDLFVPNSIIRALFQRIYES